MSSTIETKLPGKNIERSSKIVAWLIDHPLLSRNALCSLVDYDVSSLYKVMTGKASYVAIPPKYLDGIENVLRNYGFDCGASVKQAES